jgi:hypothetical protein
MLLTRGRKNPMQHDFTSSVSSMTSWRALAPSRVAEAARLESMISAGGNSVIG